MRPTVPIRWPAGKVQMKLVARMRQAASGSCSWAWMVELTVGMYGCSMTDSKAAMFTAMPVTVPARCLRERERERHVKATKM